MMVGWQAMAAHAHTPLLSSRIGALGRSQVLLAFLALASVIHQGIAEDVVIISNGDRLSGEVQSMTKSTLKLKTAYAGTLTIQWDRIHELKLDNPETMILEDKSVIEASSVVLHGETMSVKDSSKSRTVTVDSSKVVEIAPESWRLGKGGKFSGNVNVAAQIESGNSETEELDVDYDMTYRRIHDRFHSFGELELDSSNDTQTKQDWSATTKYDRFINDKLYYSFVLGFKQEKFADLHLRTTLGPSIGYQFIESEAKNLLAEVGILWINENFIEDEDQSFWGPGWRIDYDRMLLKDRVQFYHRQLGSQSVSSEGGLLWRAWTGLRFPVWNGLVLSTESVIEYDSAPAAGADTTDHTFRLKLGYQW